MWEAATEAEGHGGGGHGGGGERGGPPKRFLMFIPGVVLNGDICVRYVCTGTCCEKQHFA